MNNAALRFVTNGTGNGTSGLDALLAPATAQPKIIEAASRLIDPTEAMRDCSFSDGRVLTINADRLSGGTTYHFTLEEGKNEALQFTLKPDGTVRQTAGRVNGNPTDELGSLLHLAYLDGIKK